MGRHVFMFTCLEFKKWFVRPLELRHAMFWRLQHPLGTFARYWQNGLAPLDQRYPKRDFKTWTPESSLSSTPTPESIRLPTPTPETVGWTTRHTPQLKQHVAISHLLLHGEGHPGMRFWLSVQGRKPTSLFLSAFSRRYFSLAAPMCH